MQQIVLASNNAGKLRELKALLRPLGIDAIPQSHWSVPEAEEPHDTFLENALVKARNAARHTGLPALADDSGLCVPVLGGEPGVHSAYYAGREGDRVTRDARNNARLIEELREVHDRSAFYYCVLVLVSEPDDPVPIIADGRWSGVIIKEPHGEGGFGYDPYFLSRDHKRTAAQLSEEEKNKASHRGKAFAALAAKLRER
jgi:XTP/dITP diphosphohydrolase